MIVGRDPEALVRALDGCAAVVHLAQVGAERGGYTYEGVNVGLTERVLEDARHAGVPRVVYFSGLGVASYGRSARCSNPYFLSKLAAETILFRSGVEGVVFRPSYVLGPGDAFVPMVVVALEGGEIEMPGDGSYRMQPIAVADAAALVLAAATRPAGAFPTVFDLVGPEPVTYAQLLERVAAVARAHGRRASLRVREVPVGEAESARPRRRLPGHAAGRARLPSLRRGLRSRAPRGPARTAAHEPRRRARGRRARARAGIAEPRFEAAAPVKYPSGPMRLGITDHIDCAHLLPGHPKCGRLHGHTYRVEVVVDGPASEGMVLDFADLKGQVRVGAVPLRPPALERLPRLPDGREHLPAARRRARRARSRSRSRSASTRATRSGPRPAASRAGTEGSEA